MGHIWEHFQFDLASGIAVGQDEFFGHWYRQVSIISSLDDERGRECCLFSTFQYLVRRSFFHGVGVPKIRFAQGDDSVVTFSLYVQVSFVGIDNRPTQQQVFQSGICV